MPNKKDSLLSRIAGALTGGRRTPDNLRGSVAAQVDYLLNAKYGGSTRKMADHLGVSQRAVQLWRAGKRQPGPELAKSLTHRVIAVYAVKDKHEREALADEWRKGGLGQFGEVRMTIDVVGSGMTIQGSPKVRGRWITLDLTGAQNALLAASRSPADIEHVARSVMLDYFNGVQPGRQRPTYQQFGPDDIAFSMAGVSFE